MLKFITNDNDLLFAINEVLKELPHSDSLCGEYTLYKIENGKEPQGKSIFVELLEALMKFVNELLLKLLGGKGYSEIIKF